MLRAVHGEVLLFALESLLAGADLRAKLRVTLSISDAFEQGGAAAESTTGCCCTASSCVVSSAQFSATSAFLCAILTTASSSIAGLTGSSSVVVFAEASLSLHLASDPVL